jgi:hypothetical protein
MLTKRQANHFWKLTTVTIRLNIFRHATFDGLACQRSMSVRMVSWCVVSSSVKKASCVCTFVRPHTLLLFPYPPSCIDIPRSLAWSTENLNRRRLFLHVGHRCGAKSCGLARMFAVGSLFTVFCFFLCLFFPWLPARIFPRSCYSRWDGPSVLPGCPKW